MIDGKNLLFISSRQRIAISLLLGALLAACIVALAIAFHRSASSELIQSLTDLLKLLLTSTGVWGLIVLYASANSHERIEKETEAFLKKDVVRALQRVTSPHRSPRKPKVRLSLLHAWANVGIYEAHVAENRYAVAWCRLNVNQISTVFMLPGKYADRFEEVYDATLKGFSSDNVTAKSFGLQTHDLSGLLKKPERFLEIFVKRSLASDFLFDAAARTALANSLAGDLYSFINETTRAETGHTL
ncbi:MAG TPA: hypothetical protein VHE32_04165 [Rhodanobacteraceae bacterium]|nr:hypothetical protein [Rhodanobacteraceae bacterium]